MPDAGRQPRTAVDRVYRTLKEQIVAGQLKPGQKIDQEELTQSLAVSRIPVRTALERLGGEGWLEVHAHRGATVMDLSARELRNLYAVRLLLEPGAVSEACARLTDQDLRLLHEELIAAEEAVGRGRVQEYVEAGRRFHDRIRAVTGNPLLQQICANLWERTQRYRWVYLREHLPEALSYNRMVLEQLVRRDPTAAGAAMHLLLVHAREKVLASFPSEVE